MIKRNSRSRKNKIRLSRPKILLLLLIIAVVCFTMLFLSILLYPANDSVTLSSTKEITARPEHSPVSPPQKSPEREQIEHEPNVKKSVPEKGPSYNKLPSGKNESKSQPTPREPEKDRQRSDSTKQSQQPPKTPSVPFAIPEAEHNATLVFLFDDAGQNLSQLEKYLVLPFPISVAVLPDLPHSVECAGKIRSAGKELLLHQPMQAVDTKINPGPGAITPSMQPTEIRDIVRKNIEQIGPVSGVNNHEGSLICENETQIASVLEATRSAGVYFLDSRTTTLTQVSQAAASLGIPYYQRDIFLDNPETKAHILEELQAGIAKANRNGYVIMIGHVWAADKIPAILMDLYPLLVQKGYKFATVSNSGGLIRP